MNPATAAGTLLPVKKWIAVYVACDVALTAAWKIQDKGPYWWVSHRIVAEPLLAIPITFVLALVPLAAFLFWHNRRIVFSPKGGRG